MKVARLLIDFARASRKFGQEDDDRGAVNKPTQSIYLELNFSELSRTSRQGASLNRLPTSQERFGAAEL